MKFKPYEEYKKVDLPWIDKIPSHWEMERNKNFLTVKDETVGNKDKNYKLLSLTKKGIIERDMENPKGKFPSSFETYKIVEKNDIIFCLFDIDETPRTVGLSKLDGMITGAYNIFSINKINKNYYYYYYLYLDKFKMLKPLYTGLRKTINEDAFLRLRTPLPQKEEQDKIADFLDHNLAKIDKFVELTERRIELLKEQKEVVINDAVTKGIDKDVAYKDSGIDWIGEIPEHWEVTRLKRILISNESGNWGEEPLNNTDDIYVLRSTEQNYDGGWRIDWSEVAVRNIVNICEKYILKKEDLLLTKSSGSFNHIGKVSIVTEDIEKKNVTFSNFMQKLRVDKNNYSYYYWIILNSNVVKQQYRILSTTTTGLSNLNLDNIKNIIVILPPKQEQEEIVAYIEKEIDKIDRTIDLYKRQIELIKEYRTSLITSAVTGKIDVRDF